MVYFSKIPETENTSELVTTSFETIHQLMALCNDLLLSFNVEFMEWPLELQQYDELL